MTQQEQTEIVKKILDFLKTMAGWEDRVSREIDAIQLPWGETLKKFSDRGAPKEPKLKKVNRVYPEIVVPTTDNILTMFSKTRQNRRAAEIAAVQNSPEYQTKCAELNRDYYAQEQENKAAYEKEKAIYDTVTLPEYQKRFAIAEKLGEEKIDRLHAELEKYTEDNMYLNDIKLVPLPYMEVDILEYLYDVMSTSDYDIRQAIELYDRKVARELEEQRIQQQYVANDLAYAQAELLGQQADLLEEQNNIASKARRDNNLASIAGVVQRHNLNKYLKK